MVRSGMISGRGSDPPAASEVEAQPGLLVLQGGTNQRQRRVLDPSRLLA
jgi:hypothetical protein